jgi:hypothetical protein
MIMRRPAAQPRLAAAQLHEVASLEPRYALISAAQVSTVSSENAPPASSHESR